MNAFDQFDAPAANAFDAFDQPNANPFDQFDASPAAQTSPDSTTPSASFDSASVKDMDSLIASEKAMAQDFAGVKPVASGGEFNPGNLVRNIASKWIDTLNTATGSELDASKDPEIQKLRQGGESPVVKLPVPEQRGVPSAIIRGLENVTSQLSTPTNIEIGASLFAAPALVGKAAAATIGKVVALGFGAQMAHEIPGQISEAMDQPTTAGKAEKGTEAVAGAILALLAAKHGTGFGRVSPKAGRALGAPESELDQAAIQNQLRALSPGEEPLTKDAQPISSEVLDGLQLAREKLVRHLRRAPESSVQTQAAIDDIDAQLLRADRLASQESAARVAQREQSPPPAEGEAPPVSTEGPPAEGGTASSFTQAVKDKAASVGGGLAEMIAKNNANIMEATKGMKVGSESLQDWGRRQIASNPSGTAFAVALQKEIPGFDLIAGKQLARALKSELETAPTAPAPAAAETPTSQPAAGSEGASIGPGAASAEEPIKNELEQTSLKRAVVDPQRLLRGDETITTEERAGAVEAVSVAEDMAHEDPTHVESIISRIVDEGDKRISEADAAAILIERRRLMNERAAWEDRLGRGEDVNTAKTQLDEIANGLDRVDRASRAAGSEWSAIGKMYQQMIKDDFSLASMESRKLASFEGKLTPEELETEKAKIKAEYEKINELRREFEASQKVDEKSNLDAETQHFVEATINELGKSYLEKPSFGKKVFDIARKVVDRWKQEADGLSDEIKKGLGGESGGVGGVGGGPGGKKLGEQAKNRAALITNIAKVIRAKVGEFGLSKAETLAELVTEYGTKIKDHFENAWAKAQQLIKQEDIDSKAKEIAKKGVSKKGEKTPVEAKAEANSEAAAGDKLSQKTIVDHVRALINEGEHDTNELMRKTTEALKEHFPNLTEREVRQAFVDYNRKVIHPNPDAVETEIRENKQLVKIQEDINREMEGLQGVVDPETGELMGSRKLIYRDKPTQRVRDLIKQRNEILKKRQGPDSPEKLASTQQARRTALENAIADTDRYLRTGEKPPGRAAVPDDIRNEQLRAELKAMRDKVKEIEDEANPGKTPEERYNETRVKQAEKRTKELEALTAAGKFTKPPPKTPFVKSPATKTSEFKLAKAQQEFNRGVFEQKLKDRHPVRKVLETGRDVLNLARAAQTSFDLSAVLRQGGFITLAHPVRAAKIFPAMLKAFASEKGLFELNKEIQARPNAELYKSSKLHLNDPNDPHLSKMEEAYMSRWAQKIPGIAHSERAYTGFLNRLRADSFDAMTKSLGHPPTIEEAKAISNFVNVATGRGNLASAAGAAVSLNTAFFAPRYVLSRFELLAGQPLYHGTAGTRIAVAKEYARFLGGLAIVYGLAKASGATVSTDKTSSDFGKLKFGNTRVDMLSGLSQTSVLLSRIATGKISTPHGVQSIRGDVPFGQPNSADVLGRFLRTKLSPALGGLVDLVSGKDLSGKKATALTVAKGLTMPLSFGDIYDAMRDQGVLKGTALTMLSIFGAGIQNYNRDRNK